MRRLTLCMLVLAGGALAAAGVATAPAAADTTLKGTITAGKAPGVALANAVVMIHAPAARAATDAPHARMEQRDDAFVPHVLAVAVGTTVDFPNRDDHLHNVYSASRAKAFDLGMYGKDESKAVTFDKTGVVQIRCNVRPEMEAFVVVHANRYAAVTDARGAYTIAGAPPGRHEIRVWHEGHEQHHGWVRVLDGEVTRLDVRLAH